MASLSGERQLPRATKFTDVEAHPVLDAGRDLRSVIDGARYALQASGGEVLWRLRQVEAKRVVVEDQKLYRPIQRGNVTRFTE